MRFVIYFPWYYHPSAVFFVTLMKRFPQTALGVLNSTSSGRGWIRKAPPLVISTKVTISFHKDEKKQPGSVMTLNLLKLEASSRVQKWAWCAGYFGDLGLQGVSAGSSGAQGPLGRPWPPQEMLGLTMAAGEWKGSD